jgi:hypothetical protein
VEVRTPKIAGSEPERQEGEEVVGVMIVDEHEE